MVEIEWALEGDTMVSIADVPKDLKERKKHTYRCPDKHCCGHSELNTRKGDIRDHHFAHKPDVTVSSGGEGWLHNNTKYLVADLIDKHGLELALQCICGEDHHINLSGNVEIEYRLGAYSADIAVLKSSDVIAIEIVDTHFPEDDVLMYYRKENFTCVTIHTTPQYYQYLREQRPQVLRTGSNVSIPKINEEYVIRDFQKPYYKLGYHLCAKTSDIIYQDTENGETLICPKTKKLSLKVENNDCTRCRFYRRKQCSHPLAIASDKTISMLYLLDDGTQTCTDSRYSEIKTRERVSNLLYDPHTSIRPQEERIIFWRGSWTDKSQIDPGELSLDSELSKNITLNGEDRPLKQWIEENGDTILAMYLSNEVLHLERALHRLLPYADLVNSPHYPFLERLKKLYDTRAPRMVSYQSRENRNKVDVDDKFEDEVMTIVPNSKLSEIEAIDLSKKAPPETADTINLGDFSHSEYYSKYKGKHLKGWKQCSSGCHQVKFRNTNRFLQRIDEVVFYTLMNGSLLVPHETVMKQWGLQEEDILIISEIVTNINDRRVLVYMDSPPRIMTPFCKRW